MTEPVVIPPFTEPIAQRSDPVNFPARADVTMAELPARITKMNEQNEQNNALATAVVEAAAYVQAVEIGEAAAEVADMRDAVQNNADTVGEQTTIATTKASEAASSAAQALAAQGTTYTNAVARATVSAGVSGGTAVAVGAAFTVVSADGASTQRYIHSSSGVATADGSPFPTALGSLNPIRSAASLSGDVDPLTTVLQANAGTLGTTGGSEVYEGSAAGLTITSSSSALYRSYGNGSRRLAGEAGRYIAKWKCISLSGSNIRAGLAVGNRLFYWRQDGVLVDQIIGGSGTTLLAANASRAYALDEVVKMQIDANTDGSATITITRPDTGYSVSVSVVGLSAGAIRVVSFTYGVVVFSHLQSDGASAVTMERIAVAQAGVDSVFLQTAQLLSPGFSLAYVPAAYGGWVPAVPIYRLGNRSFGVAVVFDSLKPAGAYTTDHYVDGVSGLDTNAGTSAAPFKTLSKAGSVAAGNARITAKGGIYAGAASLSTQYIQATSLTLDSWDGRPVISSRIIAGISWTSLGGGVYSAAVANAGAVIDTTKLSVDGFSDWLHPQASQALVAANADSYYYDGTTLYIRTFDSRAPGASIEVYDSLPHFQYGRLTVSTQLTNSTLWVNNWQFKGGDRPFYMGGLSSGYTGNLLFCQRVRTMYGVLVGARTGNGFNTEGGITAYLFSCRATLNQLDGFNYHSLGSAVPKILEVSCIGNDNGRQGADFGSGSHNGSTMHDGGSVVRVMGQYLRNLRNVHDVGGGPTGDGGSWSWNLGSSAGYSRGSSGAPDNNNDFRANTATQMFLDSCSSVGTGSAYSRSTTVVTSTGSDATIYSYNHESNSLPDQAGTAIVGYEGA